MINTHSKVADAVISLAAYVSASRVRHPGQDRQGTCFTARDRIEISQWRETARQAGYDRLVVHHRDAGDALDVGSFLSVYAVGSAWSRWGFARRGEVVVAWCALTGADIGEFPSLAKALQTVLRADPHGSYRGAAAAQDPISATVLAFPVKLRPAGGSLGSAA
jgi:hypothetical protein